VHAAAPSDAFAESSSALSSSCAPPHATASVFGSAFAPGHAEAAAAHTSVVASIALRDGPGAAHAHVRASMGVGARAWCTAHVPSELSESAASVALSSCGFLMPDYAPHNTTALGQFIASQLSAAAGEVDAAAAAGDAAAADADGESIRVVVVTRFAMSNYSATFLPASALGSCRLRVLSHDQQNTYPPVNLFADPREREREAQHTDHDRPHALARSTWPLRGLFGWDGRRATAGTGAAAVVPDDSALPATPPLFVHMPSEWTHCAHGDGLTGSAHAERYRHLSFGADEGVSFIQTAAYLKMLGVCARHAHNATPLI
jgi:hypothetical protein